MIPKPLACICLSFFMIICLCTSVHAASQKRFDFLLYFFDMNEKAFAYHRHCLNRNDSINETFLRTLQLVTNELAQQTRSDDPNIELEYIKNKILDRRYNLQYRLDHANMKEGCYSEASLIAKEHYQKFSHFNKSEIHKFINEQTKETSK